MKKTICILLMLVCCVTHICAIDGIRARSAILMCENGEVLWENNADERLEPASVTKIMTLILIAEAIEQGSISLNDTVTVSQYAASMGGSQIWLEEGEKMGLEDMLKALVIVSANDVAVALAEHISGTEGEFVRKMNDKAEELGMTGTLFVNCNGLDAEGHLTTARDIAIMTKEALKHEIIFDYTKIWMDHIREGNSVLVNTNKMIRKYTGMTGLKTGYTGSAGYCLSATAERDGLSLIAVTMKNATAEERTEDITDMLNYGFSNYKCLDVQNDITIPDIDIILGKATQLETELEGISEIIVKKGIDEPEYLIETEEEIIAPVYKGQKVGSVKVICEGNIIKSINIISKNDVGKVSLKDIYAQLMRKVISR